MPVPKAPLNGWESREQLFETYAREPYCWSHEPLIVEWISWDYRLQGAVCTRYRIDPRRITCRCKENFDGSLSMVRALPTGIAVTCPVCRKTDHPIRFEVGEILGTRRVSIQEAYDIMGRTNQAKVPGMPAKVTKKDLFRRVV